MPAGTRWARLQGVGMLVGATMLAGCGGPFGPCYRETIEVALAGTVAADGAVVSVASRDAVGPSNFPDFDLVRRIVIDGEALPRQLIWTATIFGEPSGGLAVFMPGDARAGQVLQLQRIEGGGWGAPPGSLTEGRIDFRLGGFVARTIQGTLTVEAVEPLRVRLRFTATDANGAVRTADLTASFSYQRDRATCT